MSSWTAEDTSVKVALRIRPQSAAEKIEMCRLCTSVTPDHPQVVLGKDKAFTYDYVFDLDSVQTSVYDSTARELIEGCFEGYNATILAYGQTGAGKTYTMGTGFDSSHDAEEVGIIPRAVEHLFTGIQNRIEDAKNVNIPPPEFKVVVQFMELYNEDIIDLLDIESKGKKTIKIHEDNNGNIYTTGIHCKPVQSGDDCLRVLEEGALSRTTASTNMNATSSRSHAIFTILIKQHRMAKKESLANDQEGEGNETNAPGQEDEEFETLTAKFNFVDLAGSERLKRTGATGERAKEGISINQGLLSLGNVISALGDNAKRGCHVPYRDSKLTRLLQDSLGGNSRTVMIACVSPSDRDFMETLNTLKYANRARNIKNKVVVNQDKASKQIASLRAEIQRITLELLEYKQGIRVAEEGGDHLTDTFHENMMLRTENENLRLRIKGLQQTVDSQTEKITELKAAQAMAKLEGGSESGIEELVQGYVKEIEELNNKLIESQGMSEAAVRRAQTISRFAMSPTTPEDETNHLLELAKKDVRRKMKRMRKRTPSTSEAPDFKALAEKNEEEEMEKETKEEGGEEEEGTGREDKEVDEEQEDELEEEDDLDVAELSDSEEDVDDEGDEDSLREDIVDLSNEITIKQKLIEELEHSQSRLQALKHQYEEKLNVLQHKIKETESERDRVLRNIGTVDSKAEEKASAIRKQYEKKINSLTKELTKLQAAKREHNRLLKTKEHNEQQLKILRQELGDMKRTKVRLMKQMRDDVTKAKQRESKFNRQLESMIKENRKRDVDIKRLKEEKKQKDLILKRKQEEITSLRKQIKPVSGTVGARQRLEMDSRSSHMNGPIEEPRNRRSSSQLRKSPASPAVSRNAKKKWEMLERKMNDLILRMKTVANMEHDMERWLQDRDRISKQLEHSKQRRDEAVKAGRDESVIQDFTEQVEGLMAQMDFIQENILESQNTITDMEEVGEIINANEIITKCTLSEARYLLEHCYGKSVELGQEVANLDAAYKEMQMRLEGLEQHCELQQQLLQHVFVEQYEMLADAGGNNNNKDGETKKEDVNGVEIPEDELAIEPPNINTRSKSRKKRRLTGTPEEFLKPLQLKKVSLDDVEEVPAKDQDVPDKLSPLSEKSENNVPNVSAALLEKLFEIDPTLRKDKEDLDLKLMPPPPPPVSRGLSSTSTANIGDGRARSSSLVGSTQSLTEVVGNSSSTFLRNTRISKSARSFGYKPPKATGSGIKSQPSSANSSPLASRRSSVQANPSRDGSQALDSPVKMRRGTSTEGNSKEHHASRVDLDSADVFTRLTSSLPQEADPDVGKMLPVKAPSGKPDHLVCTYTATGHNNAVLSIAVTEEMLITGSKDRTAKVWDLGTGEETMSLAGHKRDVTVVRYSPVSRLVFTVYQSTIKLWDIRQKTGTCVKTISGSIFQLGDSSVMDLGLNHQGTVMYSALGNTVKMVDLRTYGTLGKLSGHHGTVTCLLVASGGQKSDVVVTGSKDHTIKVYEVVEEVTGREMPRHNLEPPHYDGVQSLALRGDVLFSGSRDNTIKKWDFRHYQLRHHLLSAHKDWVCSLRFLPDHDVLLSGCRSGSLRLWHGDSCQLLGDINAHPRSINAIATNSTAVFTASSDRLVRLWKPTSTLEEQLREFDS